MIHKVKKAGLILILMLPFLLLFLPVEFFDKGQSICPSKLLLNVECMGCGLTKAVMHFIHLDFKSAYDYNILSFVIVPVGIIGWIHLLGKLIHKKYFTWLKKYY
jgi:hypothetical protein